MSQKTVLALITLLIIIVGLGFYLSQGFAAEQTKVTMDDIQSDGPYLFYKDDGIESVSVEMLNNEFKAEKKMHTPSESQALSQQVSISSLNAQFSFDMMNEHPLYPHSYAAHPKVFTISDVEGDFEFFRDILMAQGVMDKNYKWSYGNGHLVILGDSFDRGEWVTEALWLMYKLDYEAQKEGGAVHFILGNHEIMAMSGDDRYIHKKYVNVVESIGRSYGSLFSKQSVLGDWLRSKNSIVVIGKTLFVHGGLSPVLSASGLDINEINGLVRVGIDKIGKSKLSASERLVMGSDGPLWYRDYVDQKIDQDAVQTILDRFGVDHIIIGHTVVNRIKSLYNGGVYAIDVDRKKKNNYEALLIENEIFYRVTSKGDKEPI